MAEHCREELVFSRHQSSGRNYSPCTGPGLAKCEAAQADERKSGDKMEEETGAVQIEARPSRESRVSACWKLEVTALSGNMLLGLSACLHQQWSRQAHWHGGMREAEQHAAWADTQPLTFAASTASQPSIHPSSLSSLGVSGTASDRTDTAFRYDDRQAGWVWHGLARSFGPDCQEDGFGGS